MAFRALLTSQTRSGGHVEHGVEEIIACDDFEQLAGKGGFSLAARGSPFLEQLQRSFVDLDTALLAWPPEAAQWPQVYLNQRACSQVPRLSQQPAARGQPLLGCRRARLWSECVLSFSASQWPRSEVRTDYPQLLTGGRSLRLGLPQTIFCRLRKSGCDVLRNV